MAAALQPNLALYKASREPHPLHGAVTEAERRTTPKAAQPGRHEGFAATGGVAHSLKIHADIRVACALPFTATATCATAMGPSTGRCAEEKGKNFFAGNMKQGRVSRHARPFCWAVVSEVRSKTSSPQWMHLICPVAKHRPIW